MTKNIKITLGLIYLLCLGLILYGFFVFVDVSQLNDYTYIRDKTRFLINLRDQNFIIFSILSLLFIIIWILLLGFASPIALVAGFIYGKLFGTLISVFGFTIGCSLLYLFANSFFKNFYKKNWLQKYLNLKNYLAKMNFFIS